MSTFLNLFLFIPFNCHTPASSHAIPVLYSLEHHSIYKFLPHEWFIPRYSVNERSSKYKICNYQSKHNKNYCIMFYNMFYNYMFRPFSLGHLQVVYTRPWELCILYTHILYWLWDLSHHYYTNIDLFWLVWM